MINSDSAPSFNNLYNGPPSTLLPSFSTNNSKDNRNITSMAYPLQENIGGTTYFYNSSTYLNPLNGSSVSTPISSSIFGDQDISMGPSPSFNNSSISNPLLTRNTSLNASLGVSPSNTKLSLTPFQKNLDIHQSSPFFIEPNLKLSLYQGLVKNMHTNGVIYQEFKYPPIYIDVDRFHTLMPLENVENHVSNVEFNNLHSLVSSMFTTLTPMATTALMYKKSVFKCTDSLDGNQYCLVRIHGYSLTTIKMRKALNNWKKFEQIWCVKLREVFTTVAFGDSSLIFVYEFLPTYITFKRYLDISSPNEYTFDSENSITSIKNSLMNPTTQQGYQQPQQHHRQCQQRQSPTFPAIEEPKLWNMVIQISGALRRIHSANLFCGGFLVLNHSKILMDPLDQKIKLNCLGMYEITSNDGETTNSTSNITHFQQEDIKAFGIFLLTLICPPPSAQSYSNNHESHSGRQQQSKWLINSLKFSLTTPKLCDDLKNILLYLLTPTQQQQQTFAEQLQNPSIQHGKTKLKNMNDIMPMIGARYYTHIENINRQYSYIKNQFTQELDNSRLFRLLCKINTIVERPEHNLDASWSETGDRYLLKLFRDFVFYSRKPDDGTPFLDLSHVITHLNKLDIGSDERLTLYSRDERNIIIVSYADLRKCLQTSFQELFP